MHFAVVIVAAAVAAGQSRQQLLRAVNDEAASAGAAATSEQRGDPRIEHKPIEKTARGRSVVVDARVADPSHLFLPIVFARKPDTGKYEAYTMRERGRRGFRALLPSSILAEGSFEYFIEAQHEHGEATRLGSPRAPFSCEVFDPPAEPVAYLLHTSEAGAVVRVDDLEIGRTPLSVELMPGAHLIAVTSADGRSVEQHLDVKPGSPKRDLPIVLPRQAGGPATLSVQSEPSGATVFVDGTAVGRTPFSDQLAAGEHTVAVEAEGRMRDERRVVAREGRDASLQFSLAPLPKTPALAVESDPSGAKVILDGRETGRTPFVTPLDKGRHQLLLKLDGRREVATDFAMPGDRDLSFRLDLPVAQGSGPRLTLTSSPPGAKLALDGKDLGITPWAGEVRAGTHKISVAAQGFEAEERAIQVQANRDLDVAFALTRAVGPGKLRIETDPAQASFSIDGKAAGTTPFAGDVAPGEHTLEVNLDGYKTVQQQFSLEPGQRLSLKLALSAVAGAPQAPTLAIGSDPQGAQIFVDGKLMGTTPSRVRTTAGPHEIKLALDGYVSRTGKAIVPPSRDFELRMSISLKPVRGGEEQHKAPSSGELAMSQVTTAHACAQTGDYACALASYQKAYEYDPKPRLLFNVAQMRFKLGRFDEAARGYQAFLKDLPPGQGQLKKHAEAQLAICEAKLKPPETALAKLALPLPPEVEDQDPPQLTHETVKKAMRGQPIRLLARIVDEGSGVAAPQACWRNLYRNEFACQPMVKIGEDEYGVEVPAKAVTEGFAYYLEAYDNNENGPARSGAPELPNSVAIEDAPAPRPIEAQVAVAIAPSLPVSMATPSFTQDPLPAPAARKSHLASYIATGGAVAAVVAGALLTVHADHSSSDLDRNAGAYAPDRAATLRSRIDTDRTTAKALFGVGAAFAIGAVTLWSF
jgi:tetratricopeptide (TPR) repeat protein